MIQIELEEEGFIQNVVNVRRDIHPLQARAIAESLVATLMGWT